MSSPHGAVRSGRSRRVVALTGAAGPLGQAVAAALLSAGHQVIGIDATTGSRAEVTWRIADTSRPDVVEAFAGADAVIHLADRLDLAAALAVTADLGAPGRRALAVRTAQAVVTAAAAAGVRHVFAVTSAAVLGARQDNPVPLPEDAVASVLDPTGMTGDLVEVERVVQAARSSYPGVGYHLLRPAAMVGAGVDTIITRHFQAPRLLVLRGAEPAWQFCHIDDLGSAVAVLLALSDAQRLPAAVAVAAPGSLTQAEVEEVAGMRRIELPALTAQRTADRLHRLGVLPLPAEDLDYVSHPWAVHPTVLLDAGWAPTHDNAEALRVLIAQAEADGGVAVLARKVGRPDAALAAAAGAASAAVAGVATAALLRRRRRR